MIDFKSRMYMAKLLHLFEDYVDLQVFLEDISSLIVNEEEITIKNSSVEIELFTSDILSDLKNTYESKVKDLEFKEKEIRTLIYGESMD